MSDFNAIAKQFTGRSCSLRLACPHCLLLLSFLAHPPRVLVRANTTDFYYQTFDGDRSQLAALYVRIAAFRA